MMKILHVNVVYGVGSTGKIVSSLHNYLLTKKVDSVVCYGRGERSSVENVNKIAPEWIMKLQSLRSKLTGYAFAGCYISTKSLCKRILDEKPSIVHLQNINGYMVNIYKLLDFLRVNDIPTLLTLHAEFMYTGGCGNTQDCTRWHHGCGKCPQRSKGRPSSLIFDRSAQELKLMNRAIGEFDTIQLTAVSDWLASNASKSPSMKSKKITTIGNGLDISVFRMRDASQIVKRLNAYSKKVILHVTPDFSNPLKGGKFVLEIAERLKDSNVVVIVIGYNGKNSELPSNIIPINHISNQIELAQFYSFADVTLLTSKSETFSMVCAESLSCGTPVVGFRAGGPEAISLKSYSEFVDYGDVEKLELSIMKWLFEKKLDNEKVSLEAHQKYSDEKVNERYLEVYKKMIK